MDRRRMSLGDRLERVAACREAAQRSVLLLCVSVLHASWHVWETKIKHSKGFALYCLSQNAVANSDDTAKCWGSLHCLQDESRRQ